MVTKTKSNRTKPVAVPDPSPEGETAKVTHVIRRKEMVERIVQNSGMKPNLVKTSMDAILKEIGDALYAGEALNLPALGRISVNRRKDSESADVLICKIRRKLPVDPEAEAAADSES